MYILSDIEKAQILADGPQLLLANKSLLKLLKTCIMEDVSDGVDDLECAQNMIKFLSDNFS